MELVLMAVAVGLGVDLPLLAFLGLVLFFPWGFALLALVVAWLGRRAREDRSTRFLEGVAAELRSGASLRQAVAASAAAVGEADLAACAMDLGHEDLGARAASVFPDVGGELQVTVSTAARSGSASADLFDELAALAMAHQELRREVRVAAAPGRVAAGIFLGAPVFYLGHRWVTGDLAPLLAAPAQRTAALIGLALFVVGLLGALIVLWRAR